MNVETKANASDGNVGICLSINTKEHKEINGDEKMKKAIW
jgi:hypothetical protein